MIARPVNILFTLASPGALGETIRRLSELRELTEREAERRLHPACGSRRGGEPLAGTWAARRSIPAKSWLIALAAFELELDVRESAKLSGISVPTAHKTKKTIRRALASLDPRWHALLRRPRKRGGEPLLFGVKERDGLVEVRPVLEAKALRSLIESPPAVVHVNGFTYTSGHEDFDALTFGGRWPEVFGRGPGGRRWPEDPFCRFLISHVSRCYGIAAEEFYLYIKEWELRFNHRQEPLFDILLDAVTRRMPARSS